MLRSFSNDQKVRTPMLHTSSLATAIPSKSTSADADSAGNSERYNVPALERGLRLLSEFDRHTPTLTAPDLARRLDLPRSTVFRMLSTLEHMGFIERTDGGRSYRLGLGVLRMGFEYLASLPINELGQPLLERLRDATGLPCVLVMRDGRSIVYVARVSPASPFVSAVNVGTRLPAHATVLGRVLLGDLSLEQVEALYPEEPLPTFSDSTPTTAQALHELVQADKARGYAISEGFYEANVSTIAAPVRDHTGTIVAALGMTSHASHIEPEQLKRWVAQARSTADELSGLLNYQPNHARQAVAP